jgi:hypothetical protein
MEDKHEDPFPPIDGLLRVGEECYDEHGNLFGEAATKSMGAKHDQGKVRPSLILSGFPRAILAVAEVGMYGLTMHPEGSWKEVPDGLKRYRDALQRHLLGHAIEGTDKASGLWHEAQVAWNALAVLELRMIELEKTQNQ